jgi:hypothetical protein
MFALRGRVRLNVPALAVRSVTRYKRVKPLPGAPVPSPAASVTRRRKTRDELLAAALTKPPSRSMPVPGALLKDAELVAEAEVRPHCELDRLTSAI